MLYYTGFYCLGASNQEEASNQQGLCIWMTTKPNALKRLLINYLFGAIWIDRTKSKPKKKEAKD